MQYYHTLIFKLTSSVYYKNCYDDDDDFLLVEVNTYVPFPILSNYFPNAKRFQAGLPITFPFVSVISQFTSRRIFLATNIGKVTAMWTCRK